MANKIDISEKLISEVWKHRNFNSASLRSLDGRKVHVLSSGVENESEGADFKKAQIRIERETISGDVEIHLKSSDWMAHKHHLDLKYDRVILHVVMWHDSKTMMTKKHDGGRIPIVELCDQLNSDLIDILQKYKNEGLTWSNPYLKYKEMGRQKLAQTLDELGCLRFEEKVKRLESNCAAKRFERLIYDGLFEAAGYHKNRVPFLKLKKIVDPIDLSKFDIEELTSILLGCAGLLPSQSPEKPQLKREALKTSNRLEKVWNLKRQQFNLDPIPKESWKLLKIRPNNAPIRRIIAISQIYASYGEGLFFALLRFLSDDESPEKVIKKLRSVLTPEASGFWAGHFDFDKATRKRTRLLIGENRADDIIVNVVLPLLSLYAKTRSDDVLQSRISIVYSAYPKLQDNSITRHLEAMIFQDKTEVRLIVNSAKRQQGLLQLHQLFV